MKHIHKALTFRASSIGDCLMGKYLLENIHAQYPDARCGLVVASRGAMIRDLLAAYPWIEVIEANRHSPRALLTLVKNFWQSDFVCTQYTGGRLGILTKIIARLLARRGALVGFIDTSSFNDVFYDVILPHHGRLGVPRLHEINTLAALGVPVAIEWMTLKYVPQTNLLPRLGLQKEAYVVVGLFSGADARGLSPERKQALVDALVHHLPNMIFVFTGTPKEREKIKQIQLPKNSVIAETGVQELITLIKESAGVVSIGTGTSHIASMLHVPLVVLVACQGLQWEGKEQYGDAPMWVFSCPEQCPLGHDYSGYGKCLDAIDMETVATRAAQSFGN